MKRYSLFTVSSMWSTKKLKEGVEQLLNQKTAEGYEVVSVSFAYNNWYVPTAFITLCR